MFKDISLFGSYEFPTSGPSTGGVVARSLAGIGKESKKTELQLKNLANHRSSIAGATGAVTSEEIPNLQGIPGTCMTGNGCREVYSVRFRSINGAQIPVRWLALTSLRRTS